MPFQLGTPRVDYEAGCAALGPERCAELDAYWLTYFRAKEAALPKRQPNGKQEIDWNEWDGTIYEESTVSSDPAPREETGLLSPGASNHRPSTEQPAASAAQSKRINFTSETSADIANVQQTSAPSVRVSWRNSHTKRSMSSNADREQRNATPSNIGFFGLSSNSSGISRAAKPETGRHLAHPIAPSRSRKAVSCPPLSRPVIPLTYENLQLASANPPLLTKSTPSGMGKRKRADDWEDATLKKRVRSEPYSAKVCEKDSSKKCARSEPYLVKFCEKKRKRSDGQDERATKRSRSGSRSDTSDMVTGGLIQEGSVAGKPYPCASRLVSWLAELEPTQCEHTEPPPLDCKPVTTHVEGAVWPVDPESPFKGSKPRPEICNSVQQQKRTSKQTKACLVTSQPTEPRVCWEKVIAAQYAKLHWYSADKVNLANQNSGSVSNPPTGTRPSSFKGGCGFPKYHCPTETLVTAYQAISTHCEAMGASSNVTETAKCFFHEVINSKGYENRPIHALAVACIVYAYRFNGVSHSKEDIFSFIKVPNPDLECALQELDKFFIIGAEEEKAQVKKQIEESNAERRRRARDLEACFGLDEQPPQKTKSCNETQVDERVDKAYARGIQKAYADLRQMGLDLHERFRPFEDNSLETRVRNSKRAKKAYADRVAKSHAVQLEKAHAEIRRRGLDIDEYFEPFEDVPLNIGAYQSVANEHREGNLEACFGPLQDKPMKTGRHKDSPLCVTITG